MLLTDTEIMGINQNAEFDSAIGYARKIESAIMERLKAQEHACEAIDERGAACRWWWSDYGLSLPKGTKLYTHPIPADDVVRDAARLEWLMNSGRMVICDREGCYTYTHTSGRYGPVAKTKREAIDKAMRQTK